MSGFPFLRPQAGSRDCTQFHPSPHRSDVKKADRQLLGTIAAADHDGSMQTSEPALNALNHNLVSAMAFCLNLPIPYRFKPAIELSCAGNCRQHGIASTLEAVA